MLASVQKQQITKTAAGNAMLATGTLSSQYHQQQQFQPYGASVVPTSATMPADFTLNNISAGIGSNSAATSSSSPPYIVKEFSQSVHPSSSPKKMLPFEDFYRMFRNYSGSSSTATSSGVPTSFLATTTAAATATAAGPTNIATASPSSSSSAVGMLISDSGVLSPLLRKDNPVATAGGGGGGATKKKYTSIPIGSAAAAAEMNGSVNKSSGGLTVLPHLDNHYTSSIQHHHQPPAAIETTNIVKVLTENDPQFEAYMKIASYHEAQLQLEKDRNFGSNSNAMLSATGETMRSRLNATVAPTLARKLRKMNPLGQGAVHLVDSRGRASKDSRKGFLNIFKTKEDTANNSNNPDATAGGSTVSGEMDSEIAGNSSNIISRLEKGAERRKRVFVYIIKIVSVYSIALPLY